MGGFHKQLANPMGDGGDEEEEEHEEDIRVTRLWPLGKTT